MTVPRRRVLGAVAGISALAGCLVRSTDSGNDGGSQNPDGDDDDEDEDDKDVEKSSSTERLENKTPYAAIQVNDPVIGTMVNDTIRKPEPFRDLSENSAVLIHKPDSWHVDETHSGMEDVRAFIDETDFESAVVVHIQFLGSPSSSLCLKDVSRADDTLIVDGDVVEESEETLAELREYYVSIRFPHEGDPPTDAAFE